MVGRVWRVDVVDPLYREEGRWRHVGSGCNYFVAAVRADHDPEKAFRRLELHGVLYPYAVVCSKDVLEV